MNQRIRFIIETIIFATLAISIVIIFSLGNFEFKTESLLLAVLIFGIYLVVSGRVTELGFMDFQVKLRDAETKTMEIENQEAFVFDSECDISKIEEMTKEAETDIEKLKKKKETVKKEIESKQEESNAEYKIKILYVWRKKHTYTTDGLLFYSQLNDYIVFLDKEDRSEYVIGKGKFSGFAKSIDFIKKLQMPESESTKFVEDINKWDFTKSETSEIIKIDAYIVKGISRGQSLEIMNKKNFDVLPVVVGDMIYVGIIDRNTIISHVIAELSRLSPAFNQLSKYLKGPKQMVR